jgi:ADP-ribosyl-[dinitrogen reductase] hydrolase
VTDYGTLTGTPVATLTGLAVGDALGMPFETSRPDDPRLVAWDGGYGSSEYHKLGPGQWTDDTQMSLALARSLIERGVYDPACAAEHYLSDFYKEARGIGKTTHSAMAAMSPMQGASGPLTPLPWNRSGSLDSIGNGTAMRAAPIGLLYRAPRPGTLILGPTWQDRVIELARAAAHWARVDATITHRTHEAREGAAAVAAGVSFLAAGVVKDKLLLAVVELLEPSDVRFVLEDLWRRRDRGEADLGAVIAARPLVNTDPAKGIPARVVETVHAAFACFVWTEYFRDAVRRAIRLGGDTDTVGAITGALAGTYYGLENIPRKLVETLERADEIHALEQRLVHLPGWKLDVEARVAP